MPLSPLHLLHHLDQMGITTGDKTHMSLLITSGKTPTTTIRSPTIMQDQTERVHPLMILTQELQV